ncbi:hypothetical protein [Methylobacterium aquaticum]|nr:hypothetical protein [Methylobacterium aquaticum]
MTITINDRRREPAAGPATAGVRDMGSDSDHVLVKATRPFVGDEGFKDERSEPFKVHRRRLAELKANGLAEEHVEEPAAKSAPPPENKMAPAPANKAK